MIAVTWTWPLAWSLALVYLHPLVALWFLDRELGRRKPEWRGIYRKCLLLVPVLIGVLYWRLADTPHLPGDDLLSIQIANQAGLQHRLREAALIAAETDDHDRKIELARDRFGVFP